MNAPDYHRPRTLPEAFRLLGDLPGARAVGGGTDLCVRLREGRDRAATLVSLRGIDELCGIAAGPVLRLGATTPVADVAAHPAIREIWPALAEGARRLGSVQIRNVATVGGNICNASPCADLAPPLLVHEARVELARPGGRRTLPLDEFLVAKGETRLEPGELLTAILVDRPPERARAVFFKKGRVAMDIAIASVAALLMVEGGRVSRARFAAGSVAPRPIRLRKAEAALEGRGLDAQSIAEARAAAQAEVRPISDVRASADYRRTLCGVLVGRAIAAATGAGASGARTEPA